MLSGYKTYITAGLAVITAITTFLTGDATQGEALTLIVNAVLGATIRHGISTK